MRYKEHEKVDGVSGLYFDEIYGLSSETKPEDSSATGSIFVEVDTGKVYFYNEDGDAGEKWAELGGDE